MKLVELTKDTMRFLKQLIDVRNLSVDEELAIKFIRNPNNHGYFAIIEEKVIGFVWGYTLERLDSEPMMYIHSVDIVKQYRKQGFGKQIVSRFIKMANSWGYRNTFLITDKDNIPANKLYTSLGGEENPDKVLYVFKKRS